MEQFSRWGTLVLAAALYYLYPDAQEDILSLHGLKFNVKNHTVAVARTKNTDRVLLTGRLAGEFQINSNWRNCQSTEVEDPTVVCMEWDKMARLIVNYSHEDDADCYQISWKSLTRDFVPIDCFDVGDSHWYGGAEVLRQRWTIEKQPMPMQQYLSSDIGQVSDGYGSVLERYWLSSKGVAIFVEDDVPLHFGINSSQLCFKADYKESWYPNPNHQQPQLNYTICLKDDVKQIHKYMASKYWSKPLNIPEVSIFKYPIWSTWAKYKTNVSQTSVLEFFHDIKKNGFPISQLEIDDKYTTAYGDFVFDPAKFPDPTSMADVIHKAGVNITSWIMPFATLDSKAFYNGMENNCWVQAQTGTVPGLMRWWQGTGVVLDFTNPSAVKWFFERLDQLKTSGVDSFKFDAGEIGFLPPCFKMHTTLLNPNHFSRLYAESAFNNVDRRIEVRVGYKSQRLPIMVRMMDMNSDWTMNRGLLTVIPTVLHFGLIGYPFVLPDMIGGNAYPADPASSVEVLPEKELYIRWLEVNVFLPTMQFSIAPWQYDDETVAISRKLMTLREDYITPILLRLAHEATVTGDPIIRPLWWIDPTDPYTLTDETVFLVGDDLLVAPVLGKGARKRDIYLPSGVWQDMLRGGAITGPRHLNDYKVRLNEVASFERVPR